MINFKNFSLTVFSIILFNTANAQPGQGMQAKEIALPGVTGDTLRLSSLKGKVVLLDFWASWCGPCRVSNKNLVKLYPKFKSKGFEIFAVSFDDDKGKWQKAIKQDKIKWLQVNEGGGWEAKTAQVWNINAIPTSYLIDKDGTLIGMDLTEKQLEKALKELIGK